MKTKKELIIEACRKGADYEKIKKHIQDDFDKGYLYKLMVEGLLFRAGYYGSYVYFTSRKDAESYRPNLGKVKSDEVVKKPKTMFAKDAQVTWPEHIVVKVSPTPEDTRFKFVPPSSEWVGEITKDSLVYWGEK